MKKKNLKRVLGFFNLSGFAMVFGGVIGTFADNPRGIVFAIIGFVIMVGVFVVNYLFSHRPPALRFNKQWQKLKTIL